MALVTPTASRADIAVALAPLLVAHRRQLAIPRSLDVELQSRCPSSSITDHHRPLPRRPSVPSRHRAVLIRPSPLQSQSIAVALALSLTLPHRTSPSKSRRAIHHRQGAVAPSIAVAPHRPSPLRSCPSLSICLLLSSRRRSVHCCPSLFSHCCAVHRRRTAPSITVKSPLDLVLEPIRVLYYKERT